MWPPQGFTLQRILKDEVFFGKVKERLDEFYLKAMLPELLTRRVQMKKTVPGTYDKITVCVCKSKKLKTTVIACISDSCEIKYFPVCTGGPKESGFVSHIERLLPLYTTGFDKFVRAAQETNILSTVALTVSDLRLISDIHWLVSKSFLKTFHLISLT